MYIKISNTNYPCGGYRPSGTAVRFSGVEGLVLPISGAITLCGEDGFELASVDAGDYARQIYEGETLTLTNEPEPEPAPEPVPPGVTISQEDMVEMLLDHETRLVMEEAINEGGTKA